MDRMFYLRKAPTRINPLLVLINENMPEGFFDQFGESVLQAYPGDIAELRDNHVPYGCEEE
jgi:hypothetical protein